MPLKGALVGWQGSSRQGGPTTRPISLEKYPENFLEGIWFGIQDYARIRAGIGFPRIPVGAAIDRRDRPVATSARIPKVVVPTRAPSRIPVKIVRGEPLFAKEPLVAQQEPKGTGITPRTGVLAPVKKEKEVGLDLGAIEAGLRTLGAFIPGQQDIFDTTASLLSGWGTPTAPGPTGPVITQVPTTNLPTSPGGPGIGGGGIPNLPTTYDESCDNDPMKGYVMKKVCGQWRWIKPKRRRRKVLLTESDYNGLLRIESLKVNKNMTIAIAKALSR